MTAQLPPAVDAHFHMWRWDARELDWITDDMTVLRRDFLAGDAAREWAASDVRGGVAVQARSSLAETDFLLAQQRASSTILGVVGWVDLCAPDAGRVLERYAGRLAGVRHIVQSEPDDDFLLRPDFQRGVSLLAGFGMSYDILVYPRQLPAACAFADRNPDLRLVLDHLGKPPIASGALEPWQRDFRALARRPQVHVKASGLVTEADWSSWTADQLRRALDVAFDAFGSERILFGSDYPVCLLAASYARVKAVIDDHIAALSESERARVLADNAIAFYRLPSRSGAADGRRG
jgi:L-fuconolactonase